MLTAAELCLVAEEIGQLAAHASLVKIHQPAGDRLVLRLHPSNGDDLQLLLVANSRFARAHFVREAPPNPKAPPTFCEDLRRVFARARLLEVATRRHDRVIELVFDCRLEDGTTARRRLVGELFGAHPNIVAVDENGLVVAVMQPADSGERELRLGATYADPPSPKREMAARPPFIDFGDDFATGLAGADRMSQAIERWVAPREREWLLADRRRAIETELRQQRKKLERLLENLAADLRATDEIPRLKAEGELLKASLHLLKRGPREVTLTDWTVTPPVERTLALNPMRTPQDEVAHRFDEAHRLERSLEAVGARHERTADRIAAIDALLQKIAAATTEEDFDAARAIGERDGLLRPERRIAPGEPKKKPAPPEPRKPYYTFTSKDGIEILVGRTAAENDELTFEVAHGNDFWFHVRDYPGSHVVLRARDELPQETMLDAATLAVHFSKADSGAKRDVSWTRRKFVSKARGAPPGQVLLSAHKTIHLRVEPARLARLLGKS